MLHDTVDACTTLMHQRAADTVERPPPSSVPSRSIPSPALSGHVSGGSHTDRVRTTLLYHRKPRGGVMFIDMTQRISYNYPYRHSPLR
jgi:hypothetical protein